ncbi:hypothetical protein [Candidatus Enterococcus huntleyi]|nr:hypothetical protein [Enterococcus sp. JM4C]
MYTYEVNYINYKGVPKKEYIFADGQKDAEAKAMVVQGIYRLVSVEEVRE